MVLDVDKTAHKIYNLELHETYADEKNLIWVTRVPGGWIYTLNNCGEVTSNFVRYTSEFDPEPMKKFGMSIN